MSMEAYDHEEFGPRRWADFRIHPGAWFDRVFSELSEPEKVAWLELLTLAIASYPSGRVGFCSDRQLASLLDIKEAIFSSVLKTTQNLWMVEVCNKAVVPCFLDYDHGDYTQIPDKSKSGIRYKEMTFPGLYSYFSDARISPIGERGWQTKPGSQNEKDNWDAVLRGPCGLLHQRMEKGLKNQYHPLFTGETPICQWSEHILPMSTYFITGAFDPQAIVASYKGLSLWESNPEKVHATIWSAWVDLEIWMHGALSTSMIRDKTKVLGEPKEMPPLGPTIGATHSFDHQFVSV